MSNCSVDNRTYTAVLVSCQPRYAQQFVLEMISSAFFPTLDIQNKIESIHYPQFRIENVPAGTEFKVVVYAKNEMELVKRQMSDFGPVPVKVTPIVWIFMALISVLVLMIILIGLIFCRRTSEYTTQGWGKWKRK